MTKFKKSEESNPPVFNLLQDLQPIERFPITRHGRSLLRAKGLLTLALAWRNDALYLHPAQWVVEWPGLPEAPGIGIVWEYGTEIAVIPLQEDEWHSARNEGSQAVIDLIQERISLERLTFGGVLYKAYRNLGKYIAEKEEKGIILLPDGSYSIQTRSIGSNATQIPALSDRNKMEKLQIALKNACFVCNAGKKIRRMPYYMEFEKPLKQKTAHELLKTAEQAQKSFQKIGFDI